MQQWHSIDEVLDFAIGEEKAAAEFYMRLADQSKTPGMRQVLGLCPRRKGAQGQT